ncbi:MAG: hypothetical protein R6U13_01555 [Desulfatiglandaceae bacterium]
MIRNVWGVLCRDIITDQESNSVSYIRCIEEGFARDLPVRIGPMFLGTLWEKNGEDQEIIRFRVALACPDKTIKAILQTNPITMDRPRHRLHFRLKSMEVTSFGTHQIIVEYNQEREWLQAARLPILIRKVEESS